MIHDPGAVAGCSGLGPPASAVTSVCYWSRGVSPGPRRSPQPHPQAGAETTKPGVRPAESACHLAPPADSAKHKIRDGDSAS